MSRRRTLAAWVPAVVVVPAVLAASVGASRIEDPTEAMSVYLPLDRGTTWVYAVADHGEPSGRRTRQILGPSQLVVGSELVDMVRLSSSYDAYPGQGAQYSDSYLAVDGDELLQHGLLVNGRRFGIDPPLPAYVLPRDEGQDWDYDGTVGTTPYVSESEVTEIGEVEVSGETFEDCAEIVTTVEIQGGAEGEVEVQTEWTCPDIGPVRLETVNETRDVEISEELVRFAGTELQLDLGPVPDPVAPSGDAGDAGNDLSTAGFDPQRSHTVPDGVLGRELAWTDVRDVPSFLPTVTDGRTVVLGEKDGLVSARDERTGELRWQVSLTPPIVATPTIHEDVVLVADASKALWALSLTDGSAQWVHTLEDVAAATPTVGDGVVAVPVEDATVVALDPDDGDVEWTATLGGRVIRPPATQGDALVVADSSGALTALDLDDGEELWSNDLASGVDMGPAINGGSVVASDMDGVLGAYDLEDGTLRWQRRGRSYSTQGFAVTEDRVVMVTASDHVESFALDDGEPLWATELEDLDTEAVVVGDEVLAMSRDGRATVLGLEDGEVRDSWLLPRPTGAEVVIDGAVARVAGTVVYRAQVSTIGTAYIYYAYPVTGEPLPRGVSYDVQVYGMPQVPNVPPVVDGDDLYALTFDGAVIRSTLPAELQALAVVDGTTIGLDAAEGVVVLPSGEATIAVDGRTGEQLWSLPTGAGAIYSVPAVDAGTAFIPVREVGLVAADLRSGEGRWAVPVDGAAGTSTPLPLPDGDVVYAGSGLTRYDGATGDVVWQLAGDLDDAVAYGAIAADDDRAFAVLVSADATRPAGERSRLVAADLRSGRVAWQVDLAGGAFGIGTAAGDGVVVATDAANTVSGHDADTGETLWTYRMATEPAGDPVVADGIVHIIERGRAEDVAARNFRIATLDLRTGRYVGSYEPPGTNDVVLPTVGSSPDGDLLIPTVDVIGGTIERLEVSR